MEGIEGDEGATGAGEGIDGGQQVGEIAAAPVAGGAEPIEAQGDTGGSTFKREGAGGADDETRFGEDFELGFLHPVDAEMVIAEAEGRKRQASGVILSRKF